MPVDSSSSPYLGVIDYGVGNLFNVERALRHVGGDPRFISTGKDLLDAPCLVLPGVGAFGDGVRGLKERGLWEPLREYAASGRPLLGICLGMQLLFETSNEFGEHVGLGIVPGKVGPLLANLADGRTKLPHIGWAPLAAPGDGTGTWDGSILAGIRPADSVYFVHSYAAKPADQAWNLADGLYGTAKFCAAVQKDNVVGCQFHPERSGPVGLSILANFVSTFSKRGK